MSSKYSIGNANPNSLFARRLCDLMEDNKVSAVQLSKYINKTPQAISQYKNGVNTPTVDALEKIADYFNTTTDYLLGRTNDPSIHQSVIDDTGLSPTAVNELKILKALEDKGFPFLNLVNTILSYPKIDEVLDSIAMYYASKQADELVQHYYHGMVSSTQPNLCMTDLLFPEPEDSSEVEREHFKQVKAYTEKIIEIMYSGTYNRCITLALHQIPDFVYSTENKQDQINAFSAIGALTKLHDYLLDSHISSIKETFPSHDDLKKIKSAN